ncbi:MAG: TRAP transporter large permease subunit [Gammaproteobacteria bacterium]|nr:TRAP transporter large permease subunit [Gammaproteobacteria bacterium]
MELVFLAVLIGLMILALTAGYPVAFALPGSSILAVALAGLCGWLFAGDPSAYFAQDGPQQWLSAGVTNFRSLYWDVERDTLIAIPLFVFMGIMLQRSKIAEDSLITMAQLFGPVPGGLGISVVFVGALLAATTGIVGATVIAMGLISLPAMLRNNYAKPLAAGTICASGTLGQIIPPSIVLIILADQLSSAVDQAGTARKAEYKEATDEFSMPSEFDITSASAGDMFMGALIPGLILVAIYMAYILIRALIQPGSAPPVPREGAEGVFDRRFMLRVLVALVPPLALIFAVLGSIVTGVATVNQAGAIGAVGALIMGGYRLMDGKRGAYWPALLAVGASIAILILINLFDLNIKNIHSSRDLTGIVLGAVAVAALLAAVLWSAWRAYKIDDTLRGVMVETAKTTSMVFIILIGAAMLTSAFRGFGGEHLVKEFLTGLPGGFWTQFVVVMAVIFLLGFFLDFIEIAVVVVPIVAPILLADPSANITAVWLGVMIGLNIQTSFLTPPFGFALFYLRGVAPPSVKTTQIYKGAFAFIALQLLGLAIAGYFPGLVNYMPNRTYLTSETAPPPVNPRLQYCMERRVFAEYRDNRMAIMDGIERARGLDLSALPAERGAALAESFTAAAGTFTMVERIDDAGDELNVYLEEYAPVQRVVRRTQIEIRNLERKLDAAQTRYERLQRNPGAARDLNRQLQSAQAEIAELQRRKSQLQAEIPAGWSDAKAAYNRLAGAEQQARRAYRRHVDDAYRVAADIRKEINAAAELAALEEALMELENRIAAAPAEQAMAAIAQLESSLGDIAGASPIRAALAKSRRALKAIDADDTSDSTSDSNSNRADTTVARTESARLLHEARALFAAELAWRNAAAQSLGAELERYNDTVKTTIGLRLQPRLTTAQAKDIAACQSAHRDISLSF